MPPMKRMPTVMRSGHAFSRVPTAQIERSVFDRSHGVKATFDAGYLIPVLVDPVLPGDTYTCRMTAFARLTTPIKPLMDNLYLESFFFFVPLRLVWTNFVKFMGEQANPGDSTSFTIPVLAVPFTPSIGSIWDYFGVMPSGAAGTAGTIPVQTPNKVSVLPWRCYALIYNQWFRDENLVPSLGMGTGDGPDGVAGNQPPNKRGKRHDYFTSCLPWTQKTTTPAAGAIVSPTSTSAAPTFADTASNVTNLISQAAANSAINRGAGAGAAGILSWANPNLTIFINDLRQSVQIQKLLERDARGGTRYIEKIYAHFRVRSPDERLQRAEY